MLVVICNFRWHKLLFSIKGNSVTMILDCDVQVTKELKRNTTISNSGILMIGQQLDETFYLVMLCLVMKFRCYNQLYRLFSGLFIFNFLID